MIRTGAAWVVAVVGAMSCGVGAFAQTPPPVLLQVEIQNFRHYTYDVSDYSKMATDTNKTVAVNANNFAQRLCFGDVASVNGIPVKGTQVLRVSGVALRPTPTPGQAIGDIVRNGYFDSIIEILQTDGTSVGSITLSGFAGGPPPPGAPSLAKGHNVVVTGGTGAFLGIRGEMTSSDLPGPEQVASVTEDPAARRLNAADDASSTHHMVLRLIPMEWPSIVVTADGPAVFHPDFTPVTAATPAKAGEVLISMATGMGPTRPGVDPGQPFPPYPENLLQLINSPVGVMVNGLSADVSSATGWPELVATYRVDFRVPDSTPSGTMAVQLSAAWIPGPTVSIPIE